MSLQGLIEYNNEYDDDDMSHCGSCCGFEAKAMQRIAMGLIH